MELRSSPRTRKTLIAFALMLTSFASWLVLPGDTDGNASSVIVDACRPAASFAKPDKRTQARVNDAYGNLPMSFEANQGQYDSRAQFASRGRGYSMFLTPNEAVMTLSEQAGGSLKSADRKENVRERPDLRPLRGRRISTFQPREQREARSRDITQHEPGRRSVLRIKLVGANRSPIIEGLEKLPGKSNYFTGADPKKWRTGVSNYAKVRYRSVYRGIDLVYHGEQGTLEYDFNLAPGADPKAISLAFGRSRRLRIDASGDLLISTQTGEITQRKPVAYQEADGERKDVPVRYAFTGKNQVGFAVGRHDASRILVIDPVLHYSTYLGGSQPEEGGGIAVDSMGSAYVAGLTESADFPTENPLQPNPGPEGEAFVTKLNASGTALVYSTYLGGSSGDQALAIAVDSRGAAYVTGYTLSTDFPIVNAVQPTHGAGLASDAFVTKIDSSGSALVYSTFLGGSSIDEGLGIAVDSTASAYVTGFTRSSDFPVASPMQPALLGSSDAFVTKFNSGGSLAFSTYLGGSGAEASYGVAVDSLGQAYLAGSTSSPDFPLWNPLQAAFKGRTAFKSADGGGQWNAINNGIPEFRSVNAIAVDPNKPSNVYAGTSGGVFKSDDSGASWASANTGLTSLPIFGLQVHPKDPNIVFVSGAGGVSKSTDSGASWTLVRPGNAPSIRIDPVNPLIVYAGWINGISKTNDGGATWRNIVVAAPGSGLYAQLPRAIAIDPFAPTTLYVASPDNVIYKSPDGGATWQQLGAGLFFQGYNSLAIDPSAPATIYAGSTSFGVFKSTNGGQDWTRTFSLPGRAVNSLAIDPASPSTVYAGTFGANVFKTLDGGANWTPMTDGLTNSFVYALALDPNSRLYAGTEVAGEGFVLKLNAAGSSLLYSTFLGGDEADYCTGIAVDGSGNAYVSGVTYSTNFPTANPLQQSKAGRYDAFVAKLNASGSALGYSTYLGGSFDDQALGIAVDPGGNAYITGSTVSTDFPLADPLAGAVGDPNGNGFATKVNNAGALAYSTYLGGPASLFSDSSDKGNAIAVDSLGDAYITGETFSTQFPTTPGVFQVNLGGGGDSFVAKIGLSPCSYSLSRTSQIFPMSGGSGSVDLTTGVGCGWAAFASDGWIRIVSADSGIGGGNIAFELKENFAEQYRIGALTIEGHVFTILQQGRASANCSYSISPTNSTFVATGGTGNVSVSTSQGCIWRAESNTIWVRITSNDYGVGAGAVMYSVDANPGVTARKATLMIAGQTLAIKQKGNPSASSSGGDKP